jgi:beta-N-acetylhexosaminidase
MKKKIFLVLPIVLLAAFLGGYYFSFHIMDKLSDNNKKEPINVIPPNDNISAKDEIDKQIGNMSLDEKIGQMVIAGIDKYNYDSNAKSLLTDYKVGGFIILSQNVKNSNQLLKLVNDIKSGNSNSKIPLFVSVDEEGGRIDRMPKEINKYPTNKDIGIKNSENLSYNIGVSLGFEIKSFGFNVDFAPVLDINSNPKNPIIGDRSFGADSDIVSKLGMQTMKGINSQNVISVVKHFPGHGDTAVDSHLGLPVVYNDLDRLKSFELLPFQEAVKNYTDGIMVAHILFPKIDPDNPASFSKTIINDILRNYLNYHGIVITDDMTMGAVVKNYDIGAAAVKSILAGADIVLVCHDYDKEVKVIKALKAAYNDGTLSGDRIDESLRRILKLKKKYNLTDKTISSVNINSINSKINSVLNEFIN